MNTDNDALEDEVLKRASADFMASAGASAPVLDVSPEVPQTRQKKVAKQTSKKGLAIGGGILVLGLIAGGVFLSARQSEPMSPLMAEIDAASRSLPPPTEEGPRGDSEGDAPQGGAEPAAGDSYSPDPETIVVRAEESLAPSEDARDSAGFSGEVAADPVPVKPEQQVQSIQQPPSMPIAPEVDPAELENLRQKVRALERAALTPTKIEVAEVLEDGVVLRDGRGRTVVVPQGGQVTARAGEVEGR